jgi:hypothetical protein
VPKKQEKKESPKHTVVHNDYAKTWVSNLTELKFSMHDFKTALVNARKVGGSKTVNVAEKRAVIDQLLVTNWDRNALSFWHVKYQKYDKTEGDRLHYTKNLLNGFIQRIDDKLRPH